MTEFDKYIRQGEPDQKESSRMASRHRLAGCGRTETV